MSRPCSILIATILAPHGVRGQVSVRSLAQNPVDLFSYAPLTDETGARVFNIKKRGVKKDGFIVEIEGVTTREHAEALKGQGLFVARDQLPKPEQGEVYLADVIGLEARNEQNAVIGIVEAFHDYGAGVFLEIQPSKGKSFMLPFKEPFIKKTSVENGFIEVLIPENWLAEEKNETCSSDI